MWIPGTALKSGDLAFTFWVISPASMEALFFKCQLLQHVAITYFQIFKRKKVDINFPRCKLKRAWFLPGDRCSVKTLKPSPAEAQHVFMGSVHERVGKSIKQWRKYLLPREGGAVSAQSHRGQPKPAPAWELGFWVGAELSWSKARNWVFLPSKSLVDGPRAAIGEGYIPQILTECVVKAAPLLNSSPWRVASAGVSHQKLTLGKSGARWAGWEEKYCPGNERSGKATGILSWAWYPKQSSPPSYA